MYMMINEPETFYLMAKLILGTQTKMYVTSDLVYEEISQHTITCSPMSVTTLFAPP